MASNSAQESMYYIPKDVYYLLYLLYPIIIKIYQVLEC